MIKILGRKQCFVVTISLLVIFSVMSSNVSSVQAKQPTIQEKSLQLLDGVADINVAVYSASLSPSQSDSYLTLPRQTADFTLSSVSGNLRVRCSFIGDFLQKIYISDISGQVRVNSKGVSVVDDARSFLRRYQAYVQDSFYGNLQSMLDSVGASENTTKVVGDVKLDVKVYDQATTQFTWTYVDANGVLAPAKNVNLAYEDGSLKCFVNNWELYRVAESPQVSREQAVDLALDALAKFSYNTTVSGENVSVSGFKVASVGDVSLCYLNYQDADSARGGDPFVLYPSWFVPLGFDKFYPGSVSGVYVRLWADTGKICDMVPMVVESGGVESSDSNTEAELVSEPAGVAVGSFGGQVYAGLVVVPVVLVAVGYCLRGRWHRDALFFRFKGMSSKGFVKPWSVLLCALMLAGSVFVFVPPTQAYTIYNTAGSLIFGSQIDQTVGWINVTDLGLTYFNELGAVNDVTNSVYNSFSEYGGRQPRYFDPPFNRNQMLSAISTAEANYDNVAVLYLGHMNGTANTYWVEGDHVAVTAADIDARTSGKTFFVWSWTCYSATSPSVGLPVAWTNNQLNDGSHCYIGFDGASPALSAASFRDSTGLGRTFITRFYYHALVECLSVQDTLDEASRYVFNNHILSESPLNGEFETYWPVGYPPDGPWPHWDHGCMHVYGNANIKLSSWLTTYAHDDYNTQLYPTFYINGQPVGTGSFRMPPGEYTFDVSSLPGWDFDNFYFDFGSSTYTQYSPPPVNNLLISLDCNLTVHYIYNPPPPPPPQLTVLAIDNYGQPGNVPLYIDSQYVGTTGYSYDVSAENHTIAVASPIYSGGQLHVWVAYYYDGDYYYDNPITVDVAEDKTVYALYYTYW